MDKKKRNIVIAIMVAMFLGAVEGTVVNGAVPSIAPFTIIRKPALCKAAINTIFPVRAGLSPTVSACCRNRIVKKS